ncbi:MAG: hypothetical protein LBK00_07225 [Treponema sp.]|jgi:hypothetical protein|nr:hypothetical protein [Treponema sp.]
MFLKLAGEKTEYAAYGLAGTQELDPESDYGYAFYAGIMPQGGATLEQAASDKHYLMKPSTDGKGLQHYRFTRRGKEKLMFDAEDAAKEGIRRTLYAR